MTISPIVHAPDPVTGAHKSTYDRFQEVISHAIANYRQAFEGYLGHSVLHPHADAGSLTEAQHRDRLELFQAKIAPVLRREIPDPPWGWGPISGPVLATAGSGAG